jgi:uncharacterized protein YjgD (DUF1641 family)
MAGDTGVNATEGLSEREREDLGRVLGRIARSAPAIEQALDVLDALADSGNLAALGAVFEEFDDNFSALTRPAPMGMVTNLMMLIGVVNELSYEPFFTTAMRAPAALDDAYPRFRARTRPMGLREAIRLVRRPEVAGALEVLAAVAKAEQGSKAEQGAGSPAAEP